MSYISTLAFASRLAGSSLSSFTTERTGRTGRTHSTHVTLEPRSPFLTWEARWSWMPNASFLSFGTRFPIRASWTLTTLGSDVPLCSRSSGSSRISYWTGQSR